MSDCTPEVHPTDGPPQDQPPRRLGPMKVGIGFLVLIMAVFILAQLSERSGPRIEWVHDLDAAVAQAQEKGRRIFLYVHAPNCTYTQRYDRDLFKQRTVRERLAEMIPCRIALKPGEQLTGLFKLNGDPAELGLRNGEPLMTMVSADRVLLLREPRTGGFVDVKEFTTYIHADAAR